ncbi:RluA family pseudouridine synthase [Halalkalibacter nanhaiisediminis]|uniref:Pseudouridine synthase n=1 Tax=Halalkalibacter nanhaiisediminis TaxID=688079 RepID=A0A562Q951_9BACI|nr:RluA family pseudouridine synthase [Halalkalibacter nanhaiisediminis]TWI53282.1 23S rRNA pseudouridine1911/1915/1917 synthase [Halalkalibacter nanhaiisediminis]
MNNGIATLKWIVGSDCDKQLLRLFLREHCQISKKALAEIKFNGGRIFLNGQEVTVRAMIHEGDQVIIMLPAETVSNAVQPEKVDINIVYEDEHLLVMNKEAGMATIPSREHPHHTLANAVLGYYKEKGIPATFHAVNRLDKDTSGLLVVAKHRLAHDRLSKLQQVGKLKRYYQAIVEGAVAEKEGTIDAPIARSKDSIISREVREGGQRAVTHYKVKATTEHATFVDINLETGRTHQIRVHFSHLGHPLLGDDLYGGILDEMNRQALHCYRVEFEHPFNGKVTTFEQGLPEDMRAYLKKWSME